MNTENKKQKNTRAPYGTWKCFFCGLVFGTRRELQKHLQDVHKNLKRPAWNKGLTKDTDKRIADLSKKVSQKLKTKFETGILIPREWTQEERAIKSQLAKKNNLGGYHKNGGKGKRGWYKGFWCDSSWELAWVIYNLDHGIHFIRNTKGFPYVFEGSTHYYHPDFLLDDGTYVEIKGWYDAKTLTKHESFRDSGHLLIVFDKNNIGEILSYVEEKYGKDFIRLYEKEFS